MIAAPFPSVEADEAPLTFVAVILAKMLSPVDSKNGSRSKELIGTKHCLFLEIVALPPLQLVS
jgi:hypothetical protein